jgi:hypothetical protein
MAKPAPINNLVKQVMRFEQMADLPNFEDKRRALLSKLDEAYATAETGRNYIDKNDIEHRNPDAGGMVRCVELAARVLGVLTEADRRAKDGDSETRDVNLDEVAELMRRAGYEVKKAA